MPIQSRFFGEKLVNLLATNTIVKQFGKEKVSMSRVNNTNTITRAMTCIKVSLAFGTSSVDDVNAGALYSNYTLWVFAISSWDIFSHFLAVCVRRTNLHLTGA